MTSFPITVNVMQGEDGRPGSPTSVLTENAKRGLFLIDVPAVWCSFCREVAISPSVAETITYARSTLVPLKGSMSLHFEEAFRRMKNDKEVN